MKRTYFLLTLLALILFLGYNGCQHEPDDIVEPGPDTTNCDTSNVTYTGSVYPILQQYCFACHSGANPTGLWDFTVYENVAILAADGRLLNAIKHLTPDPFYWMPQGLPMLDSCKISIIEIWVRDTTFTPEPDPSHPCDPDTVYFESDVLPILSSSCAKPPHAAMKCHDDNAESEVRLDSYTAVMNSDVITPFDPEDSDLYQKITETDPDKRMPPPAAGDPALSSEQIAIIQKWIAQGAQNLFCDQMCDTINVTYSGTIWPLIQQNCFGCHSGPNAFNNIHLENYSQIAEAANIPAGQPGSLWGAVTWAEGNFKMPKSSNPQQLPDCNIDQIRIWREAGTPDN